MIFWCKLGFMTIYQLKIKFQNILRPLVKQLHLLGVSANSITILAIGLSVMTGLLLTQYALFGLLPLVLLIRMALNAMDGMLAREHNMQTPLGAVLNELGDVVSDAFLYLPFATVAGFTPSIIALIVTLSIITEMAGVIGLQIGASRRYDGPCGKSDRAFIFGCIALLLSLGFSMEYYGTFIEFALMVLLWVTIVNRAKKALNEVSCS